MRSILAVIFVFLFLVIDLPIMGVQWIIGKFNKPHVEIAQLRIVQWAFKVVLFISGVKVDVIGEENVPKNEPVLYIGNHRGIFDVIVSYSRCPGLTGYVSKISIKKVPILNLVMERLHCLFINRDDIKQSLTVILKAIDLVKQGVSICIYPEGTRFKNATKASDMNDFKEGSFKIATKSGCKIVPMAICGTENILEEHLPWIKSTKVTLRYGQPIDPKSLSKEDQKRIGAYTQDVIRTMLEEME